MAEFDNKKDYCSYFPDFWLGVDIKECCYNHDETCSTSLFFKLLNEKFKQSDKPLVKKLSWFHAGYITIGGAIGCWLKYTSKMFKKV